MPKKIFLLGIIFFGTLLGSPVPSSAQTAPPSPTLNNATAGNRQVTLDWTPTATANGYKVKYGTTTASYPNIIDVGNATNFIVNSLANSTTYFFVVTAYNAGGESGPSNELSAQPVQVTAVYSNDLCNNGISSASSCHQGCASIYSHTRAFDNIFNVPEAWVTAGTQTGWLQYTFASPEKINKYTINPRAAQIYDPRDWTFEAYDAANSQWIVLDTRVNQAWTYQVSNEYTFSNANAYTSYRLNISANGGHVDVGLVEMEMMQLITAGAPLAITNLQVQTNNASVGLIWSEPNNGGSPITSYQIQYGTVASGAFHSTYIDDNVPGATINGLINNTAYQFRVVAVNALSNSDPSNTVIGMPGSTVSGSINANTTWTLSASPYIVIGDVTVVPGVTLTIQPGVEVRFAGNYSLTVNGTLNAAGTSSQRIKFTSHQVNPAKGDWNRIAINNGTSVLNYLQVEYADSGIYVSPQIPPTVTIQNSIFQNNRKGIYVDWESTVAINDNTITNNDDGIYVECFNSGCTPRINHNSIYNNANYNLRTSNLGGLNFSWVTIDAENNWWGTTDPQVIMGTILDFSDNGSLPTVDFVPFLDAPNGNPIVSNYLFGAINSNTTWTTAQSPYIAIANVTVGSGVTLTIQPGVEVRFAGNYSLVVDGILNAVGTTSQRIKFTSNQATPTKGDWNRIAINNGTSVLNYLQVEYADSGIYVGPQIPPGLTIQNSVFQNNRKGIYIDWGSTVVIDGNTITNNDDGIYVLCQFSGCAPRINHNSIYSNANYNLLMSTPGWSFSGITIDAENNWWGTTDPNVIMGTIWDFLDDGYSPRVDFDPFLNSLGGSPLVTGGSVTPQFFGPYDNQLATISYSLTQNANVTIKIFSYPNHVLLRTLINAVPKLAGINQDAWDGKNDNLQVLPEAVYYFEISAITSQNETGGYSPPYNSGSVQIINGSLTPANFNPAKGDLATIRYDLVAPSWVTLRVGWSRVPTPSPHRILIDNQPRDITNNTELWDGRQDNGSLVTGDWYLVAGWTQIMPENVIVIQNRSASRVTSVTSNPYVMYPQYGEMTEIKYQITRDARVTVLIKEQGGNAVRTLVNNEQKIAGQHSVIWNGKDNYGNVVSSPGHYRIEVSITDLQMPITRTLTGNITVF